MKRQFWTGLLLCLSVATGARAADPLQPLPAQESANAVAPATTPGWQLGPVDFHPRITDGVTYDDNIGLSHSNRLSAFIGSIAPELTAEVGNRAEGGGTWLALNYKPTILLFSDHTDNNTVDQSASLHGLWTMAKLTLGLGQEYVQTHGAIIEVGQRVRQETYNTDLLARYAFSDKTSLDVAPRLTIIDSAGFDSSRDWGVDAFLNHVLSAKLTGGLGGSVGYFMNGANTNQWYERALGRVVYAVATKVDVTATAGAEIRQYNHDGGTRVQPVFGLAGTYRPWDAAQLTLEGHRRVDGSVLDTGQNYVTTGVSAEIRQGVGERFYVSVGGAYDNRNYADDSNATPPSRTDNYYALRTAVGGSFNWHWSASIFYQYQADASSGTVNDFRDNQVGFQGTWGF